MADQPLPDLTGPCWPERFPALSPRLDRDIGRGTHLAGACHAHPLIALDWGTTRARAFLIGEDGAVLAKRSADRGIQSVPAGGFPAAFAEIAGEFRQARPDAKVLLAGMVGSRNGWVEAPYIACPAAPEEIAAAGLAVTLDDGTRAIILPGLSCDEGAFDVMRGEETLIVGLGLTDGVACLPGTHSKWAEIKGGRITRFASFMTGEPLWPVARAFDPGAIGERTGW